MKKLSLCFALLLVSLTRVSATEYDFGNFDTTLNTSGGVAWITPLQLELGKFATGFTPTAANADLWSANWLTGPSGPDIGFVDSDPEWGARLILNNNAVFAVNSQLYVWAFNNLTGGGREWALFTDTGWRTVSNAASDPSQISFDFSSHTTALLGTINFAAETASTAAISSRAITPVPEPATWGWVAGLSTLVVAGFRRRRTA